MDEARSWEQVEEVIKVLDRGCTFLSFDDVINYNP